MTPLSAVAAVICNAEDSRAGRPAGRTDLRARNHRPVGRFGSSAEPGGTTEWPIGVTTAVMQVELASGQGVPAR